MGYTAGILIVGKTSAALFENGLPVASMLEAAGYQIAAMEPVDGNQEAIEKKLVSWADQLGFRLILTMGGVSLKPEDVMPEATEAVCQRMIPGLGEAMRTRCYEITPRAALSRETAGIRGKTLILNVPGNAQAARENLQAVLPVLQHALSMLD